MTAKLVANSLSILSGQQGISGLKFTLKPTSKHPALVVIELFSKSKVVESKFKNFIVSQLQSGL